VGVNSGTDALWLTFMALGLKEGDEVITTANTFFATAEAIWIAGGKVVFVDCDPDHAQHGPRQDRGRHHLAHGGIVPVHLYGLSADMKAISDIARKRKLWVVEDNAQAIDGHGPGGSRGSSATPSARASSSRRTWAPWGTGSGGDGPRRHRRRRAQAAQPRLDRPFRAQLRVQQPAGRHPRGDPQREAQAHHPLDGPAAEIAARYTKGLQGTSFRLPVEPAGYRHVFHLYVIEHPRRDELEKFLLEAGVDVKLHYPIAIHKQEGYPWGKPADLRPNVPHCERNAAECVSLPMFPELTDDEVDYTIERCLAWDRQQRK
jgi:dTDP-4-amino-4,6-dideoxygalactose transaminase